MLQKLFSTEYIFYNKELIAPILTASNLFPANIKTKIFFRQILTLTLYKTHDSDFSQQNHVSYNFYKSI
jgi:hypothetical protein